MAFLLQERRLCLSYRTRPKNLSFGPSQPRRNKAASILIKEEYSVQCPVALLPWVRVI
jgi:hypothetical protein